MASREGILLADRYRLESKIGKGGMGVVWRARDERLDRAVAVKLLSRLTADDDAVARFEQEAKAAAGIRNTNVVEIYDFGESEDAFFIAMELLEGEDLARRMARGNFGWSEIREITRQICDGVGAAHDAGLVHRDLKPANVFLTRSARSGLNVRVLDFGVCTSVGPRGGAVKTKTGLVVGTPAYLAPESYREELRTDAVRDRRRDTYAIGVMLYEMITGRRPFIGLPDLDLVMAMLNEDPPKPSDVAIRTDISPRIDNLVLRAVHRQPEFRPDPIERLAKELEIAVDEMMLGRGEVRGAPLLPTDEASIPIDITGSLIQEVVEAVPVSDGPVSVGVVRDSTKESGVVAPDYTPGPFTPANTIPTPSEGRESPLPGPFVWSPMRLVGLALGILVLSFGAGLSIAYLAGQGGRLPSEGLVSLEHPEDERPGGKPKPSALEPPTPHAAPEVSVPSKDEPADEPKPAEAKRSAKVVVPTREPPGAKSIKDQRPDATRVKPPGSSKTPETARAPRPRPPRKAAKVTLTLNGPDKGGYGIKILKIDGKSWSQYSAKQRTPTQVTLEPGRHTLRCKSTVATSVDFKDCHVTIKEGQTKVELVPGGEAR